jgi:hypothetical protein
LYIATKYAPSDQKIVPVVGSCQGTHSHCAFGTQRAVMSEFETLYAQSRADLSPDERGLLRLEDYPPRDSALACRSVFGHLY